MTDEVFKVHRAHKIQDWLEQQCTEMIETRITEHLVHRLLSFHLLRTTQIGAKNHVKISSNDILLYNSTFLAWCVSPHEL